MRLYPGHFLHRRAFSATDGEIGHCSDLLIDDRDWTVRYLVVDTGRWLPGRQVVLSPLEIAPHRPLDSEGQIRTRLSRRQIEESPPLQEHAPVSRQLEAQLSAYYGWPAYWEGGSLWGNSALLPTAPMPTPAPMIENREALENLEKEHHLRSTEELRHYTHHDTDGEFGHAVDFLIDADHWQTQFTVIKTGRWFGGRSIAVPVSWIDQVQVAQKTIHTKKDRPAIEACPETDASGVVNEADAQALFAHFGE